MAGRKYYRVPDFYAIFEFDKYGFFGTMNIYSTFHINFVKMLEFSVFGIFATCIAGMITAVSRKRDDLPVWERENGKTEVEKWLTGFFAKLKRNSTRTQKCRLILSVERMKFKSDWNAEWWQYVQFGDEEAAIFNKHQTFEKLKLTKFQKTILKSDPSLKNQFLGRSEIKPETGKWEIPAELESRNISEGGEAIVFSDDFGDEKAVVRVHLFDPFLFTKDFGLDSLSWKIHFEKGQIQKLFFVSFF